MKKLFYALTFMTMFSFLPIFAKELPPQELSAAAENSDPSATISAGVKSSLISKIAGEYSSVSDPSLFREKIFYLDNNKSISELSKILRSVSTMEGIKYYATGEKKWQTLYSKACFIDSPENKNQLADEEIKTAISSDGIKTYCLLEDHSLGSCIYELIYFENQNEIAVNFFLVEPVKLGPVKAVKPGNLVINLVVTKENEDSDRLTLYMNVKAKYVKLSLIENRLNKSFERRIDSMYSWFKDQISK